jgi:hypothetical protein
MEQTAFCGKYDRDYAVCLKHAVNFLVTKTSERKTVKNHGTNGKRN